MGLRRPSFRSATAFFLVAFSTAFLMTIGMRLTGWFTKAPTISADQNKSLGVAIMISVITLAVGASIRRMEVAELRSAQLDERRAGVGARHRARRCRTAACLAPRVRCSGCLRRAR